MLYFPLNDPIFQDWSGQLQIRGNHIDNEGDIIRSCVSDAPSDFWSVYIQDMEGLHHCIADFQRWHDAIVCAQEILKNRQC